VRPANEQAPLKVTVRIPPLPPFTDAVVVVTMDGNTGIIEAIRVDSRPAPHPFTSGEGLHVTAWAVFIDSVRRGCVGVGVVAASQYVQTLCTSINPDNGGWRERGNSMPGVRMRQFTAALQRAAQAAATAQNPLTSAAAAVTALQAQIAAYLSARNLMPFAQVDLGHGQAIGGGEPSSLLVLREYESDQADYTPADLCNAIWKLLDPRTILFVLQNRATAHTLPGWLEGESSDSQDSTEGSPGDEPGWVVWKMLSVHLIEINTAYPIAFNACGLADADMIASFKLYIGDHTISDDAPIDIALPIAQANKAAAPLGWARRRGGTRRCAVSLTIAFGTPALTITGVKFGSRPTTLLNTDGHHLTAWVSFTRLVTKMVKNKTAMTALADMIALAQQVITLPNFPPVTPIPLDQDPKCIFQTAWTWFGDVQALAAQVNDAEDAPLVLQDLCAAYLAVRNALPLAAVNYGSPAGNHGEQRWVAALDGWEAGALAGVDHGLVQHHLWSLLDIAKLNTVFTATSITLVDLAPGSDPNPLVRVATAIKVHVITMTAIWPQCCQHAQLNGAFSIAAVIKAAGDIVISNADWPGVLLQIGAQANQGNHLLPLPIGDEQADPNFAYNSPVSSQDSVDASFDAPEPGSDEDDPIPDPDARGKKRKAPPDAVTSDSKKPKKK
jgi:hypothetical protein